MKDKRILEVRRLRTPWGSKIKDEALIIFIDLESRDLVTSYARNLSDQMSDNFPLAGLRMDIPPHLMSTFKMLENYGRDMKMRYGSEFKRQVRFDDAAKSQYTHPRGSKLDQDQP